MERTEPKYIVSISLYFEFYFKNHMQTYPIMSREHSGKKLLQRRFCKIRISSFGFQNHVIFKF